MWNYNEPQNDETDETARASSEDSEQPLRCPAPINVFLQRGRGWGGDTLGIRQPKQSLSTGIRQATLAPGRDLRCLGENIDRCIRTKKVVVLSFLWNVQRRLWSDRANSQADLSLRWTLWSFHLFCFAEDHIKMFMQHLCIVHFLPITLSRELQLHGAFYIGSVHLKKIWLSYGPMMMMMMMMIVVMVVVPGGGFGGGATRHEGYHHYLK